MFFASAAQSDSTDCYKLVKEAAQFADQHQFCCVWTPERHFHEFGGLFPNPSVLSAALAVWTGHIQIRAGSLISPLHHPVRIAEEWAMVDNLSRGRVAISFGSGWNVNDFLFFPDRYHQRQKIMFEQIGVVQELWRGKILKQVNAAGKEVEINIFPKPIQAELPVWVTSSGNKETFDRAGRIGANLLTHLLGQDIGTLAEKISVYRNARRLVHPDGGSGKVSVMLHTYIGPTMEKVRAEASPPFRQYVYDAISLEKKSASYGGAISGGHQMEHEEISETDLQELMDLSFERYFREAALMGTPDSCMEQIQRLRDAGVDEIACLIDFGIAPDKVMQGLRYLDDLRKACSLDAGGQDVQSSIEQFTGDF